MQHDGKKSLREEDLDQNPLSQLKDWLLEAESILDFNAMILATATKNGIPSSRTVLLREWKEGRLVFYTNYNSRKGKELLENPKASATLYWRELERQLSFEGDVIRLSAEESSAYFAKRNYGNQLGAWASEQDMPLPSRETLLERFAFFEKKFEGSSVPCPPHWGGFEIKPHRFEFWQGRENRLHDRFEYRLNKSHWTIQRLSP